MTHEKGNPGAPASATGASFQSTQATSQSAYQNGGHSANPSRTPRDIWVETPDGKHLVRGRNVWALLRLMERGERGVTPADEPSGPRWAAYVFNLKNKNGLDIETITETHGGGGPDHHVRYVLHTRCTPVEV